jgi:tetratricopeptide (TPR) repeat protein
MITSNAYKVKIFCSYAHKDLSLKKELEKHLRNEQSMIWSDSNIKVGERWEDKIRENLENADIVLLLISPDFKASTYCVEKEMKRALEREEERAVCVIPIMLSSIYWPDAPYRHIHMPNSGKPVDEAPNLNRVLAEVAAEVDEVIRSVWTKKNAEEKIDAGKPAEAWTIYEKALGRFTDNAVLYGDAGDLLIRLQRYEEALQKYEQAIRLQPDNGYFYEQKGFVLTGLRRYKEALAAYQEAVRLLPHDFVLYKRLGDALRTLGRKNEALKVYKEALDLSTGSRKDSIDIGNTLFGMGSHTDALIAYKRVSKLQPKDLASHVDKGYVFNALGEHTQALQVYEEALRLDNRNAQIWRDKGNTLVKLKKRGEAEEAYKEAISCSLEKAYVYEAFLYRDRAENLFELESYEEARKAYDEAISRKSDIGKWYEYRAKTTQKIIEMMEKSRKDDLQKAEELKNARNTSQLK